jgi:dipeptidase D
MNSIDRVLEIFKEIVAIPHCSHHAENLKSYIMEFAMDNCYVVLSDNADNILVKKDAPKIAFQSHYDMVCVGDAPTIVIKEEKNILRAENSTLGADNGIGVAIMLYLIENDLNAEFLFTANEEVGLIGATNLELELESHYLINLDSEEEGDVFIGCAGGVEIVAQKRLTYQQNSLKNSYLITIEGLPGGHSGVDIDKDIPNAIKELISIIRTIDRYELVAINGGVATNAIPFKATAQINTNAELTSTQEYKVEKLKNAKDAITEGKSIIELLDRLPYGVLEQDKTLSIPKTSINLGVVSTQNGHFQAELFARSMDNLALKQLEDFTLQQIQKSAFQASSEGHFPAWRPENGQFAQKVLELSKEIIPTSRINAIHAGLECGIIKDKFPHIEVVSIGPNIYYPHSVREYAEIQSIAKIIQIVEKIVEHYG